MGLDARGPMRDGWPMQGTGRPSPAALIATIALVLALAGSAVALPPPGLRAVSKAKVKKIADKRIAKAAPGLSVADSAALGGKPASAYSLESEPFRLVGQADQPPFTNGWDNYGSGSEVAAFYKDPLGVVHLRGAIAASSTNTSAFTLPAGYRPGDDLGFAAAGFSGSSVPVISRVDIQPNGEVFPRCTGSNCSPISLDGITFRGEQ